MNKFEQVSSVGHKMSVVGGIPGPMSGGGGPRSDVWGGGPGKGDCTVRSKASWVMATWGTT